MTGPRTSKGIKLTEQLLDELVEEAEQGYDVGKLTERHPVDPRDIDYTAALGVRVRQARLLAGLSQRELSNRVGISRTSVTNIEAGRQAQSVGQAYALADALGVDIRWLVSGARPDDPVAVPDVDSALIRDAHAWRALLRWQARRAAPPAEVVEVDDDDEL